MKKSNNLNKYLFEYNLITINILSVFILFISFGINSLIEKILRIDFMETTGINVLENVPDSELNIKLFSFCVIVFVVVILWFILHEIIHGIAYRVMGARKEDITYGVVLEKGIFYCKCGGFVNKACILISVIAPFLFIGVFTYIIGVVFNLGWLVYLSLLNIIGASGDLAMLSFFIFRDKDIRFRELDDSTTFCLETTEDLTNKKFLFVKLKAILDKDIVTDTKNKLINITKTSMFIFIGCFVLLIVSLILMFI